MGHHKPHGNHHHHHQDRYVTGDTNWESYELPQLVAMVTDKVDLRAMVALADDWRTTGNKVVESSHELADALDGLMEFWSGDAAEQARTDVALNAQWLSDLGATAYEIGSPVEESAGALKAAQDQMPLLPTGNSGIAPGSAPDGAAVAGDAGGPLGEAIGGAVNGTESAAEAQQREADLKRQAVETMRRFETVAMDIDQAIPQFEGPSTVLRPRAEPKPPTEAPVSTTITSSTTSTVLSWQELTGVGGAGPSSSDPTGHGRSGLERALPVGAGAGAVSGLSLRSGQQGAGSGGGRTPGAVPGAGPGAGAAPVPGERAAATLRQGAIPGAMIDPDGHAGGMGGAGAPMGGMGAGAGAGMAGDHRRRVPVEADDPFALDKKASPPVIGL